MFESNLEYNNISRSQEDDINDASNVNADIDNDNDNNHINEGWFLYWKTSASLWKGKLEKFPKSKPLFIPLNWAHHFITETTLGSNASKDVELPQYDFGKNRPDTNIAELASIATELELNAIFLFPTTPNPLFANGGIPAYYAKSPSQTEDGITIATATDHGKINRIYSFFDPRVYKGYSKFSFEFSRYLNENNLNIHIAILNCGYFNKNNQFISYFEDYSPCFENGLIKYSEVKRREREKERESESEFSENNRNFKESNNNNDDQLIIETKKKIEFYEIIKDLYITTAKESIGDNFEGVIETAFLGGAPLDIINRSIEKYEHSIRYFPYIMHSKIIDVIPTTLLLPPNIKEGKITKVMNDFLDVPLIQNKLENLNSYENNEFDFSPLNFFHLYTHSNNSITKNDPWKLTGLINYLDKNYTQTYTLFTNTKNLSNDDSTYDKSYFLIGANLSSNEFYNALKIFMNGGNVIIDTYNLHAPLMRKLDAFFIENSVPLQKINYVTEVTLASLGQGKMILFNRQKIGDESFVKKHSFWENIISYFNIDHLKLNFENDVFFQWKGRRPFHNELEFIEIRRVIFYNPSSYKRTVKIQKNKNFVLLKTIDEQNVFVNPHEKGLDIDLMPNSSVGIDFGHLE
ncbi:MAG: hypothetical protein HQK49_01105 [Oligoflexia bacterium]|nr:hypothetical protein [Oligoflexia bacterium]